MRKVFTPDDGKAYREGMVKAKEKIGEALTDLIENGKDSKQSILSFTALQKDGHAICLSHNSDPAMLKAILIGIGVMLKLPDDAAAAMADSVLSSVASYHHVDKVIDALLERGRQGGCGGDIPSDLAGSPLVNLLRATGLGTGECDCPLCRERRRLEAEARKAAN